MKRTELSTFLKGLAVIAGAVILILYGPVAVSLGQKFAHQNPELRHLFWPFLLFLWASVIPFYLALGYAWRIFNAIAQDASYTPKNVLRLKRISFLALIDCLLYFFAVVALLLLEILNPGVLLVVLAVMLVSAVVCAVSAALSHLVEKAYLTVQDSEDTR